MESANFNNPNNLATGAVETYEFDIPGITSPGKASAAKYSATLGAKAGGLIKQLGKHVQKLADYMKDPKKHDNKDLLENAPNKQIQEKVKKSRIDGLFGQIENYTKQIE